jgi:mono/diheme cytochrome c family protein
VFPRFPRTIGWLPKVSRFRQTLVWIGVAAIIFVGRALGPLASRILAAGAEPADVRPAPTAELYRSLCQRCHGPDGHGVTPRRGRDNFPDFAHHAWQGQRTDAQMMVSILDGLGTEMPPFRGRLSNDQVRNLVARIRSFAPPEARSNLRSGAEPSDFEAEFRRLKDEFEDLRRQIRDLGSSSR